MNFFGKKKKKIISDEICRVIVWTEGGHKSYTIVLKKQFRIFLDATLKLHDEGEGAQATQINVSRGPLQEYGPYWSTSPSGKNDDPKGAVVYHWLNDACVWTKEDGLNQEELETLF